MTKRNYQTKRFRRGGLHQVEIRVDGKLVCTVAGKGEAYGIYPARDLSFVNASMYATAKAAIDAYIRAEEAALAADAIAAREDAEEWAQAREEHGIDA